MLGVASFAQGRVQDAASWYRKAIEDKPDFTTAHYKLGYCLWKLGDSKGAIEAFRAAVASDASFFDGFMVLGHLLAKQGRQSEARTMFQRAARLRPSDPKPKTLLRDLK